MKNKSITIAALIIAIIGLSIGFAAFSNTLTIRSSASVNPDESNFVVEFASMPGGDQGNVDVSVSPELSTIDYGDSATIPYSNKKTLTGVHAIFTAPNQKVIYNLYVRNAGKYVAYLKDLTMGTKTCSIVTKDSNNQDIPVTQQATPSLKDAACEGISIIVKIDNITLMQSGSLNNLSLSANGGYLPVTITITYAEGSSYVDGPIDVNFGTISFTTSSNPGDSQQGGGQNQGGNEQQGGGQDQGGQEEPAQVSDALVPTSLEIEQSDTIDEGFYSFIGEFGESAVSLLYFESTINLETEDGLYVWYCDSTASAVVSSELGTTILPYKWYKDDDGYQLYAGPSPISLSDFSPEDIKSESYVTRVINSFSNNG